MTRLETIDVDTLDHVSGGMGPWGQLGLNVAGAAIKGAGAGAQQGAQNGRPILGAIKGAGMAALQALGAGWPGGGGQG